ncbi:hypothetical protein DPMN_079086 [Dreissena polymorpha]|uniref:Uncharacterized protein n=1 Tax=Dreissena polymorpha TaxID=45954 RepID=A0A9D3YQ33_DREPO|nr:hypothetical protein DPMN_079086 [Dreissena polymorpha]
MFNRHEKNCVPGQLVAEFYRTLKVVDVENMENKRIVTSAALDKALNDIGVNKETI